jgi:hypothetical protein
MPAKNDITGDTISSKIANQKTYADNWEKIFGKKKKKPTNVTSVTTKKNKKV